MNKSIISTVLFCIGALLFNLFFWHEKQGLNTLFFDIFIVIALWRLDRESFSTPSVKVVILGTLLSAALIVYHNSLLVKWIHVLSFATMIGLVQQRELRFLGYALIQYFINWFEVPSEFIHSLKSLPILRGQTNLAKRLNGAVLTVLILPVFYLIYYLANAKFAELSDQFWGTVFSFFSFDINIYRVLFFILGIFIVGAVVWQQRWFDFFQKDAAFAENLAQPEALETNTVTYQNAFNLIIALNILLFINNVIDIRYVWFGEISGKTALELKEYVHEGTYILIFGIVLAISIILWFYRGDLNFWDSQTEEGNNGQKQAFLLRGATTTWLMQNALLALSVGVRNVQYIFHFGLAYKRVGVFVFLLLTLYGLRLLYLKIKGKHTLFFFIQRSAYALYAVLLATCLINWDVFITKFNITFPVKSGSIDVRFLVEDVSDKNLYLLFNSTEKLLPKMPSQSFTYNYYRDEQPKQFATDADRLNYLKTIINNKKTAFEEAQKGYSWLSWNYPDYVNKQFFK
jgi:hypothetical protein